MAILITKSLLEQHQTLTGILSEAIVTEGEGGPGSPVIVTATLPNGRVNEYYEYFLSAEGGMPPYSWSIVVGSMLPLGLTLSETGVISGIPTEARSRTPHIKVTDSLGSETTKPLFFTIDPPLPVIPQEFSIHRLLRKIANIFKGMHLMHRIDGEWVPMVIARRTPIASQDIYVDHYLDTYAGTYDAYTDIYTETYV